MSKERKGGFVYLHNAETMANSLERELADGADARQLLKRNSGPEGMRWTEGSVTDRLSYAGITATCTCGPHGLLTNWIAAVRRKAAKAGA